MAEDETRPDELLEVAERLYAGPAEEFTEARNAAAKGVDKALAAEIKKLKKPSVAAWAVNLLVRSETEQIDSVLALAASLRAAAEALDGDELRALTRQRRQLTSALATAAQSHARDAGVRLTGPVVDQVEGMLTAAMLDPVAAQVVRTGRVVTAFTSTGVSDLDVAAVVAVPEALDVVATARLADEEAGDAGPPELHVVPDDGAKRAAAEDALAEAEQHARGGRGRAGRGRSRSSATSTRGGCSCRGRPTSCAAGSPRSTTRSTRSTRSSRRRRRRATTPTTVLREAQASRTAAQAVLDALT